MSGPVTQLRAGTAIAPRRAWPVQRVERRLVGAPGGGMHYARTTLRARDGASPHPPRGSSTPAVVQRYLKVGATDFTRRVKADNEDADTEAASALSLAVAAVRRAGKGSLEHRVHTYLQANQVTAQAQLKKWIEDKSGLHQGSPNLTFGRKQQARYYRNYRDLALALYGWLTAKPDWKAEKVLARQIERSPIIKERIDNVLMRIHGWIGGLGNDSAAVVAGLKASATNADWASYISWSARRGVKATALPKVPYTVLEHPAKYSMRKKVAVLHDVAKFFTEGSGTAGDGLLNERGGHGLVAFDKFKATTSRGRKTYRRPASTIINRGGPLHLALASSRSSKEETHRSFRYARAHAIPVWARHSYTAARMMRLAQQAGADDAEVIAVGYAIAAFWHLHYDHTTLPYHTLHEVLDFAPHFGTPYNPLTRYADVREELEPAAPLLQRLKVVAESPGWSGSRGGQAPDAVTAILDVLDGSDENGEKLQQIKTIVEDALASRPRGKRKTTRLYRILAGIPDDAGEYDDGSADRSRIERIAMSLRVVLQQLKAFEP